MLLEDSTKYIVDAFQDGARSEKKRFVSTDKT